MVREWFPWVFALSLWLIVLGGAVKGGEYARDLYVTQNMSYSRDYSSRSHGLYQEKKSYKGDEGGKTLYTIVGGIGGLIGGFLVAVLAGGFVATVLTMDENLQYLNDKAKEEKQNTSSL